MRFYAQTPVRLTRQVAGDLAVLAWVVVWILVARAVHGAVMTLAVAGKKVEDAGNSLSSSFADAADGAGKVPLAGDALATPFEKARDAANGVAAAGVSQQDAVAKVALILAVLVALVPITWLLVKWLPGRVRWVVSATAAARTRDRGDAPLLALRALAHRPVGQLHRVDPSPGTAFLRGDRPVIDGLAAIELAALGLRPPGPVATRT
ncbi:hypothetical protein ACXR2U_20320 [Jatrophihabitans sp. YIM 134969]